MKIYKKVILDYRSSSGWKYICGDNPKLTHKIFVRVNFRLKNIFAEV